MSVQEAFEAWMALAPYVFIVPTASRTLEYPRSQKGKDILVKAHYDGECCKSRTHCDKDGQPLPDHHKDLCARELAWRRYVRLRDGMNIH